MRLKVAIAAQPSASGETRRHDRSSSPVPGKRTPSVLPSTGAISGYSTASAPERRRDRDCTMSPWIGLPTTRPRSRGRTFGAAAASSSGRGSRPEDAQDLPARHLIYGRSWRDRGEIVCGQCCSIRVRRGGCRSACRAPKCRSSGCRARRDRPVPFDPGAVIHRRVLDRHQFKRAAGDDKPADMLRQVAGKVINSPARSSQTQIAVLGSSRRVPACRQWPRSTSPTPCRRARRQHRPRGPGHADLAIALVARSNNCRGEPGAVAAIFLVDVLMTSSPLVPKSTSMSAARCAR